MLLDKCRVSREFVYDVRVSVSLLRKINELRDRTHDPQKLPKCVSRLRIRSGQGNSSTENITYSRHRS